MGEGGSKMFINTYRYKNINDFVNVDITKKNKPNPIAGASAYCGAIDYKTFEIKKNLCFSCMFCLLKEETSLQSYFNDEYLTTEFNERIQNMFNGEIVSSIPPKHSIIAEYKSFEEFTNIKETQHISPWAAGVLEETASKDVRIGTEVAVPNKDFDRPGRLDVCAITDDYLLMLETKINLEETLNDERFISQFEKYTGVINDAVSEKNIPFDLLLMIGGEETDLLFSEHPKCTSNVGNMSERFYDFLIEYDINFISANALWLMALGFLNGADDYSWDKKINKIFDDTDCVGILTAGKVMKSSNGFRIDPL